MKTCLHVSHDTLFHSQEEKTCLCIFYWKGEEAKFTTPMPIPLSIMNINKFFITALPITCDFLVVNLLWKSKFVVISDFKKNPGSANLVLLPLIYCFFSVVNLLRNTKVATLFVLGNGRKYEVDSIGTTLRILVLSNNPF